MRYALVTGGSRGLGRAVCLKLAAQGWPVVINYRSNDAAAHETLRAITEAGGQAELLPFDVADPEAIEQALGRWSEAHPDDYIAVVVNNAGIRRDNLMVFMQNDEWHRVLDTTLNGFFYVTRRLLKEMLTHRWGRIVNMASLSGIKGLPGQANYSAAKAALLGATKALAQEVAPRKVTVNAVASGIHRDRHDPRPRREGAPQARAGGPHSENPRRWRRWSPSSSRTMPPTSPAR